MIIQYYMIQCAIFDSVCQSSQSTILTQLTIKETTLQRAAVANMASLMYKRISESACSAVDAMPRPYFLDQPAANGAKWQDLLRTVEPCVDQVGNQLEPRGLGSSSLKSSCAVLLTLPSTDLHILMLFICPSK